MAEYKGLTIRIGGDTSQLDSALKSSTKAAASLQREIRQITTAMRFDPGNLANVDTRMKLTTNRAEALNSKIALLKNGYKELGDAAVTVGGSATSVKKLAESTENISLAAEVAQSRYNKMTENLSANYRELEARAKEAGKAMNLNALSRHDSGETFEKQMAELKELGVVTDEEVQKLRNMRSAWHEAFADKGAYEKAEQLQHMSVQMQRLESEARNATATVRGLNTVSNYSAESWQESASRVKQLDSALTECAGQARAYEAALREDPSNMSAAIGRMKALASEYDAAEKKAAELSRQVEAYKGRLSGALDQHRNLPLYIQQTGDEWEKVHADLAEAQGKANALHQSLQRLKDAQAPVGEIQQLEAAVQKADERVDTLKADARDMDRAFETAKECAELQQLQSELAQTTAHMAGLRKRMDATHLGGGAGSLLNASTIKSLGMTLYSTLTPAITMLGWRAVTAEQDMDSAYRDMRKTVEGTEAQFEGLKQAAIDFSKTHVTSAEQMLQIEAIGGELGIATDSLQAFAETVSNLDVATNLSTEDAATSLGQLANITHMTADEYAGFSDALVRLGNNGASTETQIIDIATRIGSMATIVGLSVPEILALSSSIASTGQGAESAGTAISRTLSDMESAVANGGAKLEAFASVAGMSAEDFARSWESEPIVALREFVKGLNRVESDGGSATVTLQELGITGTRQIQAIEGLMQTIGGLDDNLTMSRDAWDGVSDQWGQAGDAANEASKKAEGFSGQLSILKNMANDALAELAEGAVPWMKRLTGLMKGAMDVFEGLGAEGREAAVGLLAVAAVSGPMLTFVSTLMTAHSNVKKFFEGTSAIATVARMWRTGTFTMADGTMRMVGGMERVRLTASTFGKSLLDGLKAAGVIAAIAAVVMAVQMLYQEFAEHEKATSGLRSAMDGVGESAEGMASRIADAHETAAEKIADVEGKLGDLADSVASSNEEYAKSVSTLERYESVVGELAFKSNRSADETRTLLDAVNNLNKEAGTSYGIDEFGRLIDTSTGKVADNTDAIKDNIEWVKARARLEVYEDDYKDAIVAQAEAEDALAAANAEYETFLAAWRSGNHSEAVSSGLVTSANKVREAEELLESADYTLATLEGTINDSQRKVDEHAAAEKAASAVTDDLTGNMKRLHDVMGDDAAFNAASDALAAMHVGAGELSDVDMPRLSGSFGGTMADVVSALRDGGVSLVDFDEAIERAGGMSVDMSRVSAAAFSKMAADAGGDVDRLAQMLAHLNVVQIGDKTFYVSDNGTVLDESGELAALQSFRIEDKTFYVGDDGTVFDSKGQLVDLDGFEVNDKTFKMTDDGSIYEMVDGVFVLRDSIGSVPTSHVTEFTARDWVSGTIELIKSRLAGLDGVAVTVEPASAAGSIASSPYVPRHARGYIAAGPTLTNNGWVGEDGAEAVLNWGTGGVVVPLTNHRYMEPIAAAIARNMADGTASRGAGPTVNMTVVQQPGEDVETFARRVVRELEWRL